MLRKLLAVLIICTVLSVGCSPLATPMARPTPAPQPTPQPTPVFDLLADSTCAKPCVLGITPGVTTESEAWTILKDTQLPLGCYQKDESSPEQVFWDRQIMCDSGYSNPLFIESRNSPGVVDEIVIWVFNTTLEQLIAKYGPPDEVVVTHMPDDPGSTHWAMADMIYSKIQAVVSFGGNPGELFVANPNTQVRVIHFSTVQGVSRYKAPQLTSPWHGYGVYGP